MPPLALDVTVPDGSVMDAYLHEPTGVAAATVILYPDAGGVRPLVHAMAEKLAGFGYRVAVPNLYHRSGEYAPFDLTTLFSDPQERARLGAILQLCPPATVMADTGALLEALAARDAVPGGKVGVVGYCMGRQWGLLAAGTHPERVAALASFHGGFLATDEPGSPHRLADRITARLYFAVAEDDPSCSPESQAALTAALTAAGVEHLLEVYPGARHGFAVPDNPSYDRDADERHWRAIRDLFAATLPAT